MPNMVLMMPKDENEGQNMVYTALNYNDGPIAMRFPRGNGIGVDMDEEFHNIPIGSWETLKEGKDAAILTFGTTIPMAMEAAQILEKQGLTIRVINSRFIKPIDSKMLTELLDQNIPILTIEEAVLQGGFGSAILEYAGSHGYHQALIDRMGIPDQFIEHGDVDSLLKEIGLTTEEVVKRASLLAQIRKNNKGHKTMKNKERLDVLLVDRGLIETREKAKRAIMAGLVYTNEERLDKPGEKVKVDIPLTVKGNVLPYVSRGGLKLEKALKVFDVNVQGKVLLDIGASTGGFTDCALQNGAKMSYALDVGYNQLAWKLRQDERVVVMERTNFRYVTPADLSREMPNFATIDVSFISLTLILPVLKTLLIPGSDIIALVKPQFEAGREQVGKKGIVRDDKVHLQVIEKIINFAIKEGYAIKTYPILLLQEEMGILNFASP